MKIDFLLALLSGAQMIFTVRMLTVCEQRPSISVAIMLFVPPIVLVLCSVSLLRRILILFNKKYLHIN